MKYCNKESRKIPSSHENPIDDLILEFIEYIDDNILPLRTDPNYITIFRFIISTFFWYRYINEPSKNNATLFIFIFLFNYFMDCVDGYIARKCDSVTVLGDILDHVADISIFLMWIYTMCPLNCYEYIILGIMLFLNLAHFGCQQKYYNNPPDKRESLDVLIPLCFADYRYLRHFSSAILFIVCTIMFYNKRIRTC